jgi:hypothetical protein
MRLKLSVRALYIVSRPLRGAARAACSLSAIMRTVDEWAHAR